MGSGRGAVIVSVIAGSGQLVHMRMERLDDSHERTLLEYTLFMGFIAGPNLV